MTDSASQLFKPVRVERASGHIVQQIRENIFEGKLTPGDRLPTEKELTEQFGVSRVTVRDALRVLESQGLVEIKVGAGGGAFVTNPGHEPVSQVLTDMLRMTGVSTRELVEARLVIETAIVTFAAQRATPDDFARMREAIAQARALAATGDPHFTPYSVNFHIALAYASKNAVLVFTVNSFRTPFYETLEKMLPDEEMGRQAIEDHQKILDAIIAKDAKLARRLMSEHLAYFEKRAERLKSAEKEER